MNLEVCLQNETIWLKQPLMAVLYQATQQNISQHIRNIFEEWELAPEATIKKFLTVRQEGNRDVRRELDYYNLEMIISEGEQDMIVRIFLIHPPPFPIHHVEGI